MKKSVFSSLCAILVFFCGSFVSCGQKKNKPAATENLQVQNPELAKLNRVLSSMSERAKNVIPNGNPEEFLADLHRVLESRKNFSSEDLSPFYLIDKNHTVGADYEPKNLVHLEKNDLFARRLITRIETSSSSSFARKSAAELYIVRAITFAM